MSKILSFFGFKSRNKMAKQENIKPNNIVKHRYETVEILEQCLKDFGYSDWKIDDQSRPGILIELKNNEKLTDQQIKTIHDKYVAARKTDKATYSDGE